MRLRELPASDEQLRRKLDDPKRRLSDNDAKIAVAFDGIRQFMDEFFAEAEAVTWERKSHGVGQTST